MKAFVAVKMRVRFFFVQEVRFPTRTAARGGQKDFQHARERGAELRRMGGQAERYICVSRCG